MTRREELEQARTAHETALTALVAVRAENQRTIAELQRVVGAGLDGVPVQELHEHMGILAGKRYELDVALMAEQQLAGRVADEEAALAPIRRDLAADERAEIAAQGGALIAALEVTLGQLQADIAELVQLNQRHMALDTQAKPIPGYSGTPMGGVRHFVALNDYLTRWFGDLRLEQGLERMARELPKATKAKAEAAERVRILKRIGAR